MDRLGVVVAGGAGRMGRMLIETVSASDAARLVGVTVPPGHAWAHRDLGEAMGGAATGVPVTDDPIEVVARAGAVIDFTTPAATVALSE
ncbi:MAG: 4-hydroxy-tetrahydrodipicolinate reductase, partial [Jannaschia sp.]